MCGNRSDGAPTSSGQTLEEELGKQLCQLRDEILRYNAAILDKPSIVVLNKSDLVPGDHVNLMGLGTILMRGAKFQDAAERQACGKQLAKGGHPDGAEGSKMFAGSGEQGLESGRSERVTCGAPVVVVSAKSGQGVAALEQALQHLLQLQQDRVMVSLQEDDSIAS
jgi:tRNA U34 5-carboxymethylaminomethyl modifying GTPase MnmE/TrmE